jgi:ubiquinone/menaquinone biosynthesis C-methylase UbiE
VRGAYSAAAEDPQKQHPFPVGRGFAESLGYPGAQLSTLPAVSVEAFAGVSNVSVTADIPLGATVLDLGCGAGLDSLLAAAKTGPLGKVIGVDFSASMLDRARRGASEAGLQNIECRQADAERLPLADASIDVALVNGIFNLNPQRDAIFHELARVVRSGGVVYAAELILRGPVETSQATDEVDWFA